MNLVRHTGHAGEPLMKNVMSKLFAIHSSVLGRLHYSSSTTNDTSKSCSKTTESGKKLDGTQVKGSANPPQDDVVLGNGLPPEPPTNCCMSACPNCVWLEYANELAKYYSDGGARARNAIEQIEDASMKAFLMLELKDRWPK